VTLTALSAKAKLPVSTVSRIANSLVVHGLLDLDAPTRCYVLGARLAFLGSRVSNQRRLAEAARPVLERLCAQSGEDSGLSVLRGTHALIADRAEGPHALKIIDVLGRPVPLYCGAFRKLLLAYQTPEWIDRYLDSTQLVRFTPRTPTSRHAIRRELRAIRERGCSVSFGEYLADAGGVAAPVFDPRDEIAGAVFVVGPRTRITEQTVPKLTRLVVQAGLDVTRLLRGDSGTTSARPRPASGRGSRGGRG